MKRRARKYAYKKWYLRILAAVLDFIGHAVRSPKKDATLSPQRVLVVRLDQLGDIVQTLPFFSSLKRFFPDAEIHCLTTSVGAELLSGQGVVDRFHVWNCSWFGRTRTDRQSVLHWIRKIRTCDFDCVFELRGDIRLITLLKFADVRNLVGYGATGGGFLLDVEVPWDSECPAVDKNSCLLEALHIPVVDRVPRLLTPKIKKSTQKPVIAIHPDAGTEAKRWPLSNFVQVINQLKSVCDVSVVLVGLNKKMGDEIMGQAKFPVDNQMGKTNLKQLIDCLNQSDGLLSNDSGPAHLMAALGKPVWVIWSGTADKSIWSPRGDKVILFDHAVPCAPCSLSICPVSGHPCVSEISPEKVTQSITAHLNELLSAGKC